MWIPRLFKDMPKDFHEQGQWELRTFKFIHHQFATKYYIHSGRLGIAYLKVRFLAWLRDLQSKGEGTGIGWSIDKIKENGSLRRVGEKRG